jgi:uncharacterized protein YdhG (YjbR/CyaY superfamily)
LDDGVREYIDQLDPGQRPLFDRMHALILAACPEAVVGLSYKMPTYRAGKRRLYLGAWQHGVSLYGWPRGRDGGFAERHPDLRSGKATIRIRPQDAHELSDEELTELVRAALTD